MPNCRGLLLVCALTVRSSQSSKSQGPHCACAFSSSAPQPAVTASSPLGASSPQHSGQWPQASFLHPANKHYHSWWLPVLLVRWCPFSRPVPDSRPLGRPAGFATPCIGQRRLQAAIGARRVAAAAAGVAVCAGADIPARMRRHAHALQGAAGGRIPRDRAGNPRDGAAIEGRGGGGRRAGPHGAAGRRCFAAAAMRRRWRRAVPLVVPLRRRRAPACRGITVGLSGLKEIQVASI